MSGFLTLRLRSMDQPSVRVVWLGSWLAQNDAETCCMHLEELLTESEGFSEHTAPGLLALVAWVSGALAPAVLHGVATHAHTSQYFHLRRMLAHACDCPLGFDAEEVEGKVPNYGRARPLTLGERKSLARRPARRDIDRLLRDPHPAVIEQLLQNPKLTETDLLRMVTARSLNSVSIRHVVRQTRWLASLRVRSGLVNNPRLPLWQSVPILWLCTRPELDQVVRATNLPLPLREAAGAHLARRPPIEEHLTHRTLH